MPRPEDLFIPKRHYPEPPKPPEGDLNGWARDSQAFLKDLVDRLKVNDQAVQIWANRQPGAARMHQTAIQSQLPQLAFTPLSNFTVDYDTNAAWAHPIVQSSGTFAFPATGRWFVYISGEFYNQDFPASATSGTAQLQLVFSNPVTTPAIHAHYLDFALTNANYNDLSIGYNLNVTNVGQVVTPTVYHNLNVAASTYGFKCAEFSCFQLSLPPTSVQ